MLVVGRIIGAKVLDGFSPGSWMDWRPAPRNWQGWRPGCWYHDVLASQVFNGTLVSYEAINILGTTELTALYLGIKQLWDHCECLPGRIYTDSQAAMKAIDHTRRQSGQTIIKDILESIDEVVNEYTHLQIEIV